MDCPCLAPSKDARRIKLRPLAATHSFLRARTIPGKRWCPFAEKVHLPYDAGAYRGGGHKILHHSTEGTTYAGALSAYKSVGVAPHFTDTYENGHYVVRQHIALNLASTALRHPAGTMETNRANCIQIEHVGFAAEAAGWERGYLLGIARLCDWIEAQFDVMPAARVLFAPPNHAQRLDQQAFFDLTGHCGHEHAASNFHVDPGAMSVGMILAADHVDPCAWPHITLRTGSSGIMVKDVQKWLNTVRRATQIKLAVDGDYGAKTAMRVRQYQMHHGLTVDGAVGWETWRKLCKDARR